MNTPRLHLTRSQILSHRRHVGALRSRLPSNPGSLELAARPGLQDSMPRAALLSIHARVTDTGPTALADPSLVQIWGPRYSAYVVAVRDVGVFTLGRMADDDRFRRRAEGLAQRIHELLGDTTMTYGEAGRALGESPNMLRYATTTGTIRIEWDGARQPTIRSVPPPRMDVLDARLELARRHLHVFGPSTAESFAKWAGVRESLARSAFSSLGPEVVSVVTPIADGWVLESDVARMRSAAPEERSVRLLPSGDAYYLLWGDDRRLLVPDAARREELWTTRVWPGAILADGEIVGTWRRKANVVTLQPWTDLERSTLRDIEVEATSLPLPSLEGDISVEWSG